jgi:hypothetical protein
MGKSWDSFVPSPSIWRECLRVLKPGGHLLTFFGTRTHDMGTLAIRLAGFEVRDTVLWVYGSGFPKSMDVSKAIDKAAGVERLVVSRRAAAVGFDTARQGGGGWSAGEVVATAPASDAARQWEGWGTALKPAVEPITVARKPLIGTVAANVLEHGTGALNIDGCRVESDARPNIVPDRGRATGNSWEGGVDGSLCGSKAAGTTTQGRWPANLIHDGSDEVLALFPDSSQTGKRSARSKAAPVEGTQWLSDNHESTEYTDSGSAARFFYSPKASKKDRNEGLPPGANRHETVKPTDLMAYLCRLVTPPGGIVLDPFMGSGSTGKAAMREGFKFIGIERDEAYFDIAEARIMAAKKG